METKIALVTGSNRGIGLATVKTLAEQGHKVILTSRNEVDGKESLEKLGTRKTCRITYWRLPRRKASVSCSTS